MRMSLYADDATIFVAPVKEDIQQLTSILANFGEVTGPVTNLEKSTVAPIRCDGINLDDVLESFPAKRSAFPMRYLGLPLSVYRLRKIDLQHLVDKAAGKLVPWQGRFITAIGRTELLNLSSCPRQPFMLLQLSYQRAQSAPSRRFRGLFYGRDLIKSPVGNARSVGGWYADQRGLVAWVSLTWICLLVLCD